MTHADGSVCDSPSISLTAMLSGRGMEDQDRSSPLHLISL
jgi:hypothetical protein